MATKAQIANHRDFVTSIQDALDREKLGDPLVRATALQDGRRSRSEERILALETERKAVNLRIDEAIARERKVIKDLEEQAKRIRVPGSAPKGVAGQRGGLKATPPAKKAAKTKKAATKKRPLAKKT